MLRRAHQVVNTLLEAEEADPAEFEADDMLQFAYDTFDPQPISDPVDPVKFSRALRDQLVERGWRQIVLKPVEDMQWHLTAGWIDDRFRAKYYAMGARVTGEPEAQWNLGGRVAASLKGGLNRVGCKLLSLEWPEEFTPLHDGLDLESLPDDFEDDPGDWRVTALFTFAPKPKFWKILNQATPPEPPAPHQPVRSLLTPEEQEQRDEEHRQMMARLRDRVQAGNEQQ